MSISESTRQAYSEVFEFVNLLDAKTKVKIPGNIIKVFEEERDKEYIKNILPDIPVKKQNLKEETLAIIAYLNLQYICEDEEEKERLLEVYKENQKKYDEVFQVAFNENVIFAKTNYDNESKEEQLEIIKKESLIKRLLLKIKRIFKN